LLLLLPLVASLLAWLCLLSPLHTTACTSLFWLADPRLRTWPTPQEKELAALRQELREKDGKISELSARLDAVGEKLPV
jgi:hypothetical protein